MFENARRRFANWLNQTEKLTLEQLVNLLNLSGVSRKEMCEATYFACIRILSESVGKLPLKIMQNLPDGGVKPAINHPLYNVLRYRPNPYQSATAFWNSMEQAKHHDGNAIALICGAGRLTRLWQLPWANIEVWCDDKKIFGEENSIWYLFRSPKNGQLYKFNNDEIIHLRSTITRDGIIGVPVRDCLSVLIRGAAKSDALIEKMYDTGFTARAVLQYTGSLDDAKEKTLVGKIQEYAEGKVDVAKSLIPIPYGMSVTPLNIKLTDAQYVEVRKYTALQIAAAFGIKPHQINDMEKTSYASVEAQQLAFYVDKLLVELKGNEEEVQYKVLSSQDQEAGYVVGYNTNAILRADAKTKMDRLVSAVTNGIYTPNEARALEDKGSKPGGDRLYINGGAVPLELAGQQSQQKTPAAKSQKGRVKHTNEKLV